MTPPNGDQTNPTKKPLTVGSASGLIVVAVLALQLATFALERGLPDKVQSVVLAEPQASKLHILDRMEEWHLATDNDGVPLGYSPRSWQDTQEEISRTLQAQTRALEQIAQRLEKQ